MKIIKPLKNRPTMYNDESVEGFVYRLATINYVPTNYLELGKLTSTSNTEQITNYITSIEVLSGVKIIEGNLMHDWNKDYFTIPGWNMKQSSRFCPKCLSDRSYHRLYWGFSFITHCSLHQVYLIERCSYCKKRLVFKK